MGRFVKRMVNLQQTHLKIGRNPIGNDSSSNHPFLRGYISFREGIFCRWFSRWWFQLFLIFTHTWGSMFQFDDHIFQTGWFNHVQPPTSSKWSFFFEGKQYPIKECLRCFFPTIISCHGDGIYRKKNANKKHDFLWKIHREKIPMLYVMFDSRSGMFSMCSHSYIDLLSIHSHSIYDPFTLYIWVILWQMQVNIPYISIHWVSAISFLVIEFFSNTSLKIEFHSIYVGNLVHVISLNSLSSLKASDVDS